ncbi:MAG: DUF814 domain-containing protein [Lentisphaerae bacterium]|nr:DUF814 domain-containing protein [Lentisphaerota bacterium]
MMTDNGEPGGPTTACGGCAGKQTRCLSLLSGGLDSMLAICVLRGQGVHVEAVSFASPFFNTAAAQRAARALNVRLHTVDFTDDILELIEQPPHGFGGHMNPCIDCHARMVRRAGERMTAMGFDCVATGEVLGQRPMSQNRHALDIVIHDSGMEDFLVRPLSAKLMAPSRPEREGLLDRERLLGLSGRSRKPQMALAAAYGIRAYPTPAGGCLLTDEGFCRRLANLLAERGIRDLRSLRLLRIGRHMRLPGGSTCIIGRNQADNESLHVAFAEGDVLVDTVNVPGPTLLIPFGVRESADIARAVQVCAAYSDHHEKKAVTIRVVASGEERLQAVAGESRDAYSSWVL